MPANRRKIISNMLPVAHSLGASYLNVNPASAAPWDSPGMSKLLKTIDDKPLEDPVYSPIDFALAPIGAAGVAARLGAMVTDPFINIGADYIVNGGLLEMFGKD